MAGSSGFSVTISAKDSASGSIDAINRKLAAMQAPVDRVGKSLGKLAETSGLTRLSTGMRDLARSSLQAFENIGRIVAPLGAITGAASIAGIVRLTTEWANFGSKLGFQAQRVGASSDQLMGLQGAARLAGSSAESLTSGITSLNDNLTNAANGSAPQAVAALGYLKIALRDSHGQLRKATDVLPELSDKLAAIHNPTIQAQLATMLLGGSAEDLLPFIRQGSKGIAEYVEKARSYGVINDRASVAANELRMRQVELSLAVQGLGNSIAEKLAPVLGPMLLDLATWIKNNRDIIGTDIAGWLKTAVPEIKGFATNANAVAQALGGWKTVIEGIIAINLAGWAAGAIGKFIPLIRLLALIPGSGVTAAAAAAVGVYAENKSQQKAMTDEAAKMGYARVDHGPLRMPTFKSASGEELTWEQMSDKIAKAKGEPPGWKNPIRRFFGQDDPALAPPAGPGSPYPGLPNPPLSGPNRMPGVVPPTGGGRIQGDTQLNSQIEKQEFIRKMTPLAEEASKQTGVDPRIIIAQAGVETGWGRHAPGNNYFGIKGSGQTQMTQEFINGRMVTVPQSFAGYKSLEDSVQGYADFINRNPRYAGMKQARGLDQQIAALGASGYATDPSYAAKIAAIARGLPEPSAAPAANIPAAAPPAAPPANIAGGTGAPPPAAAPTTIRGGADLRIKLDGFPMPGTRTTATTDGDLFNGPPRVEHAMTLASGP